MQNQTVTIDDILDEFITKNQEVFDKLVSLNLILEAVEITLVPIEHSMSVRIREYKGNALKTHHKNSPLMTREMSFDDYIQRHLPASVRMRMVDTN